VLLPRCFTMATNRYFDNPWGEVPPAFGAEGLRKVLKTAAIALKVGCIVEQH